MTDGKSAARKNEDTAFRTRLLIAAGRAVTAAGAATPYVAMGMPLTALMVVGVSYYLSQRVLPQKLSARSESYINSLSAGNRRQRPGDPVFDRVDALAERMNLPTPHVFLVNGTVGNVIDTAAVDMPLDKGCIKLSAHFFAATVPGRPPALTPDEQDAVIAHELAHLRYGVLRDGMFNRLMTATALGGYALAALGGAALVFSPFAGVAAGIGLLAAYWGREYTSRRIEYYADETAVAVTGNPAALASGLEKYKKMLVHRAAFNKYSASVAQIGAGNTEIVLFKPRPTPPDAVARMDRRLNGPLARVMTNILGTHPTARQRYNRIRNVAAERGLGALPAQRPATDMSAHLRCLADGTVLPPFAVPDEFLPGDPAAEEKMGGFMVAVTAFRRAAQPAPQALLPPPRPVPATQRDDMPRPS